MSKIENKIKGSRGEALAASYLKNKGYRVLSKNYTTPIGEIDLIVTDDCTLVFVEVKARFDDTFGLPAEAVTQFKRGKINQVASTYIMRHRLFDVNVRFDVIEIYLSDGTINHIENAFDSYLRY